MGGFIIINNQRASITSKASITIRKTDSTTIKKLTDFTTKDSIIIKMKDFITSRKNYKTDFITTDSIITINKKTDSTMMTAFITKANPMESRNAPSQSLKRVDQRDEAENTKKLN